jgi:hypothetical protein
MTTETRGHRPDDYPHVTPGRRIFGTLRVIPTFRAVAAQRRIVDVDGGGLAVLLVAHAYSRHIATALRDDELIGRRLDVGDFRIFVLHLRIEDRAVGGEADVGGLTAEAR